MKTLIYIILISISLLSACSIKKRNYRQGYYINWVNKSCKKTANKTNVVKNDSVNAKILQSTPLPISFELATTNNKLYEKIIIRKKHFLANDTCGDVINLRDGSFFRVKIIEITDNQIKYKRCDNIDGPLIVVNKNDIYSIKYTNGVTDNFIVNYNDKKNENIQTNYKSGSSFRKVLNEDEKQTHPLVYRTVMWTAMIYVISAFAIPFALYNAHKAKIAIMAEPNKYKGLKTIKVCQIICWSLIALSLIGIVAIILLFSQSI